MIVALRTEALVMRSLSFGPPEVAISAGALTACLGDAAAVDVGCGRSGGHWKVEAEGLDEEGHGTRRGHDAAGSNGGAEAALMSLGSDASMLPARRCAQKRRQSVRAPKTSPL